MQVLAPAVAADLVSPLLLWLYPSMSQHNQLLGIYSCQEIWGNLVPVLRTKEKVLAVQTAVTASSSRVHSQEALGSE